MTLSGNLIAISSVSVAGGTAYPVVRSRVTTRYEGPEGQDTVAYRVERWELTCHAFAADAGSVGAMSETIRDDLCGRGQVVTLTEWAGSRELPAAGANGSLAGYPMVELADVPDDCFGQVLTFTLVCETRIPQPGTGGLVEHTWERTEETDPEGDLSITQRGTYRVANGGSARDDAQTEIITPAETAADDADQTFRIRWTMGPDSSVVTYEYTAQDKGYAEADGVVEAQLTDRTIINNEGRVVRTVSGYAVGDSAQSWIDTQAPIPDATNILVRKESSPASIPEGRVTFSFELLTGVTDVQFPGITIFGFAESIDEAEQVEQIVADTYLGSDPQLRYGEKQASSYIQRTRVSFIGTWAAGIAAVTGLFDDENLLTVPRVRRDAGAYGIKTIDYTAIYVYPTPVSPKPDPREIGAIG